VGKVLEKEKRVEVDRTGENNRRPKKKKKKEKEKEKEGREKRKERKRRIRDNYGRKYIYDMYAKLKKGMHGLLAAFRRQGFLFLFFWSPIMGWDPKPRGSKK
jgi:nucleosome binding factor SPN SPT16 subunit